MIGERWQQILNARGDDLAVHHAAGTLTFAQLDQLARAQPAGSDFILAQGDAVEILIALIAGALQGKPVHVAEKDRARRAPASPTSAGTALIKQTVGGSGLRRCQFFTAAQVIADVDRLHHALGLDEIAMCVAAISPAHSYGLTVTVLQTLLNGVPMHVITEPFPAPLNAALRQHSRVFLPGIPALWKAWLQAGVGLQNVALALSAGSPLTLALEQRAFDSQGLKLHNLYGTSECGAVSYDALPTLREDDAMLGTLLPGVTAHLGADQRLIVHSDAVGIGYDEPQPGEVFGNGEFATSDRVQLASDGLRFMESIGDGINVAGRKLSPHEIVAKLRIATGVTDIRVHGKASRDPERCEEIVATVGIAADELTMSFRQRACADLAPWEVPRQWIASGAAAAVAGVCDPGPDAH